MEKERLSRLELLDVLRGLNLFYLVVLEMVLRLLAHTIDIPQFSLFMQESSHMEWEEFSTWDLVISLFLFMAGVSMFFSLFRYKNMPDKIAVYRRTGRRTLLFWVFGIMCQGNLLASDPDRVYLYSNTLQLTTIGYLIASLLFLYVRTRVQVGIAAVLLLTFWGVMEFITVGNYGEGSHTPGNNLAEWIDRIILGHFRSGATVENREVIFATRCRYTWILSSLDLGITVLTGLFARYILKNKLYPGRLRLWILFGIGLGMVTTGWLWGIEFPTTKKLWISSMVLMSNGHCFSLMGLFYYWIDYKGHRKYTTWLGVYGMSPVLVYMPTNVVSSRCIGEFLFLGTQQYLGNYYPTLIAMCNVSAIHVFLYVFHKHNIFLKA